MNKFFGWFKSVWECGIAQAEPINPTIESSIVRTLTDVVNSELVTKISERQAEADAEAEKLFENLSFKEAIDLASKQAIKYTEYLPYFIHWGVNRRSIISVDYMGTLRWNIFNDGVLRNRPELTKDEILDILAEEKSGLKFRVGSIKALAPFGFKIETK